MTRSGPRLVVAIGAVIVAHTAAAAPTGEELADRLCTQCHSLQRTRTPGRRGALSFPQIMASPSISASSLRDFLRKPHADMTEFGLTDDELDALIPYLLSFGPKP